MKHQKTIEQKVISFIKKNNLISNAKNVLIGLSGGADSVFALHFFNKFSKKYNIEIAAIHVNHNLRGKESENDEIFCRKICKELRVKLYNSSVNVSSFAKKNKKSIEEAARILRYREFTKVVKVSNSDLVVTAHNNDDNTETVLLNIVSGAGLNGISGIPLKRENIVRPFICISKDDIIKYLLESKLKFVEDSSNKNLNFKRNFFRYKIIPELKKNVNPSIDDVILNSSDVFKNQGKIIEYFISQIIESSLIKNKDGLFLSISEIKKYPEEVLGEVFKTILISNFGMEFSYNHYEKLRNLLVSQVGSWVELGNKIIAYRERGKILFLKENNRIKSQSEVEIGQKIKFDKIKLEIKIIRRLPKNFKKGGNIEFIAADNIKNNLVLRPWKIGDRIQLLGMKGTKKVSDVLTDLKIPSYERKSKLVLLNKNEIVWIVGLRISEKYKINSKTKNIIKLCLS